MSKEIMLEAFKTVLVPVDFSVNTEVAVTKAITLIDGEDAVIHLLHVLQPFAFSNNTGSYADCEKKLQQWKGSIEECHSGVQVQVHITITGPVQRSICQAATELRPDLIVIGQSATHSGFAFFRPVLPMALATATGIPVLTVKPGALHNRTKTVVVPVADALPESKMQALELLCRKGKPNIHLVTFVSEGNATPEFSASVLLQMYQWLKSRLRCPVDYAVVHGTNKAKAILQYAEKMNADILVVHPVTETRIGWGNQHISDVLPRGSKVQVLAL
jgi:nucleotide-binding universal stress UspA family protein